MNISEFLANNYVILIIISVFLIFSLVGFFVKRKKEQQEPFKINNEVNQEIINNNVNPNIINNQNNINNPNNVNNNINRSLQDMVKENADIKRTDELL